MTSRIRMNQKKAFFILVIFTVLLVRLWIGETSGSITLAADSKASTIVNVAKELTINALGIGKK